MIGKIFKAIVFFPFTIIKSFINDVIINDIKTLKRVSEDIQAGRNPMPEENWKELTTGWGSYFKKAGWMYLIIFAAFYFAGYQAASNNLQDSCNEFIIEEYSHCRQGSSSNNYENFVESINPTFNINDTAGS